MLQPHPTAPVSMMRLAQVDQSISCGACLSTCQIHWAIGLVSHSRNPLRSGKQHAMATQAKSEALALHLCSWQAVVFRRKVQGYTF